MRLRLICHCRLLKLLCVVLLVHFSECDRNICAPFRWAYGARSYNRFWSDMDEVLNTNYGRETHSRKRNHAWPWTLTDDLDLRAWPRKRHDQPQCRVSRWKIINSTSIYGRRCKQLNVRIYLTQLHTKLHIICFMYWSISSSGQVGCVIIQIIYGPEMDMGWIHPCDGLGWVEREILWHCSWIL